MNSSLNNENNRMKNALHLKNNFQNTKKEFNFVKKDVDEFDLSTEYLTNQKSESDGEDF